jgi:hypothetical protein
VIDVPVNRLGGGERLLDTLRSGRKGRLRVTTGGEGINNEAARGGGDDGESAC